MKVGIVMVNCVATRGSSHGDSKVQIRTNAADVTNVIKTAMTHLRKMLPKI